MIEELEAATGPDRELDDAAQARVRGRMKWVDAQPPEVRALIHEHGLTIIKAFLDCGVKKPRHIRHLISAIREGSKEIGDRTAAPMLMGQRLP